MQYEQAVAANMNRQAGVDNRNQLGGHRISYVDEMDPYYNTTYADHANNVAYNDNGLYLNKILFI